jgi:2-dehydropantoate 2-reductase
MKWSKLFTNLVGNAASAILDLPVADIFAHPRLYALEAAALRECLAVMLALSHPVVDLPGVPVRLLAWAVQRLPAALARPLLRRAVGAGRGGKMPSLHVDLHGGRGRTEVEWLNGAVARHAAAHALPAPVNQLLCDTVVALASGRLDPAAFRRNPSALLTLLPA